MCTFQNESEKHIYLPGEVADMLQISKRKVYYVLGETDEFKVIRFGKNVRVDAKSFDKWFHGSEKGANGTYTPEQIADMLKVSAATVKSVLKSTHDFRVLNFDGILRAHKTSFDRWVEHF